MAETGLGLLSTEGAAEATHRLAREPELGIDDVAAYVGLSVRTLRERLARDRARSKPRLQFHGQIGRRLVWKEAEARALYEALRKDHLAGASAGSTSSSAPDTGGSRERLELAIADESSDLSAYLPTPRGRSPKPKRPGSKGRSSRRTP